jgi:hypothetical protein
MILATALSLLLAVTTYPSLASASAMGAVYDSPIVKKMSPIQRVLEQRRLEKASCTRTILGNTTTICEEESGFVSTCTVYPDGTCDYTALDMDGLETLLVALSDNMTDTDSGAGGVADNGTTDGDELSDVDTLLLVALFYIIGSESCTCADSTPDCSMTNITDYTFNACTADAKKSTYTCEISEASEDTVCCDVVDSKGEMECCLSESEASVEYECTAGSDSSKVTITEESCTATHNGESCSCEYCDLGSDIDLLFVAYDCSAVGGSKRKCPGTTDEDDIAYVLDMAFGSPVERSILAQVVDPRTESASNGMVVTFAMTVTTLVFGLLF